MDYRLTGVEKSSGRWRVSANAHLWLRRAGLGVAALFLIFIAGRWLLSNLTPARSGAEMLEGTWDLERVGNTSVGSQTSTSVISQRIYLQGGKLRGETMVRVGNDEAPVTLPFPDESVRKVIPSADSSALRVLWDGTYDFDDRQQIALHIGKAIYFVRVSFTGGDQSLEFNQDTILTIPGAAYYHRASGKPSR